MPYPRPGRRAQAVVIAAACSLTYVTPSRAAEYTWTGNGSTRLFTAPGNWSAGVVPGSADDVTFATGFKSGTDISLATNQAVNSFIVTTATPFSISAPLGNTLSVGTLYVNVPNGSPAVTLNAPVLISPNNSITVSPGATVTLNNSIGFTGGLTDTLSLRAPGDIGPGGTVNFNAATALRDFLRVTSGVTLNLRHPSALGTASLNVSVASTAAFYADTNVAQPTVVAGGTVAVHQSHVTFSGTLTVAEIGSASPLIDLTDAGTVTLNGSLVSGITATPSGTAFAGGVANLNSLGTYAGTITLAAGNTANVQSVASAPNASFLLRDNSTLVLPATNKGVTFTRPVILGPGGGAISVPGTSTFQPVAGQITHNNQTLTKSGPGTLYLTNDANLDAPITVADGSLFLAPGLAGTKPITVNAPGIVYAGGYVPRPLSGNGTISLTTDAFLGNPAGSFSFAGNIDAVANTLTLLSSTRATVAGTITLSSGARLASLNGLSLTATSALLAPSGNTTLLSPVTAAGTITGPTGTSATTFASDLTSTGTATGNLRLQRAFTSTGTLNAGTLTLDSTVFAMLVGSSTAASTTNHGQLRILGGSHSLGALTGLGTTTVNGGTLTATRIDQSALDLVLGFVTLTQSSGTPTASALSSLTLAPGTTLNLTNNPLVLDYTGPINSPLDRTRQYLLAQQLRSTTSPQLTLAYIESATLAPARRQSLTNLTIVDDSSVIIALALKGDANLDGVLNADDYTLLDRAFARSTTNARWTDGDFNYDGTVNQNDYLLLDTAYLQQQGGTLSLFAQREQQFGAAYVSQLLASVPEPSTLFAACGLALPLLARTRRPTPPT